MKWKKDVTIETEDGFWLIRGQQKKLVEEDDIIIAQLIKQGITDDDDLIEHMNQMEEHDDVLAALRLAQFVEDYGYYLDEAEIGRVIEP